jgi:hypothetical protein
VLANCLVTFTNAVFIESVATILISSSFISSSRFKPVKGNVPTSTPMIVLSSLATGI